MSANNTGTMSLERQSICLRWQLTHDSRNRTRAPQTAHRICATMEVPAYRFKMGLKTFVSVRLDSPVLSVSTQNTFPPDINECIVDNGGCHHDCVNTIGTFYCRCWAGFELEENGKHCKGEAWL
ncbi:calcium binding EGF domain protein [Ancylostoma duodenale]|uniref:Calcium binding EGF domain protein n=1 Tax=Ancylostoma duodenale TaxID=51022 RepID=A0A0C2G972_9BILA|nr:calcium binding EGF domain protein [Ancylostoma duodenale]